MTSLGNLREIHKKCSTTEMEKLKSDDSEHEKHFRNLHMT